MLPVPTVAGGDPHDGAEGVRELAVAGVVVAPVPAHAARRDRRRRVEGARPVTRSGRRLCHVPCAGRYRDDGALFVDALTLDGLAYDYPSGGYRTEKIGAFFYGTGVEAKLDATIFYHVPVQFIFGLYYGTDSRSNYAGVTPVISFGL